MDFEIDERNEDLSAVLFSVNGNVCEIQIPKNLLDERLAITNDELSVQKYAKELAEEYYSNDCSFEEFLDFYKKEFASSNFKLKLSHESHYEAGRDTFDLFIPCLPYSVKIPNEIVDERYQLLCFSSYDDVHKNILDLAIAICADCFSNEKSMENFTSEFVQILKDDVVTLVINRMEGF